MTDTDPKPKLVIVYGTGTNNTRSVAEGIESGAVDEGVDTVLLNVADLSKEEIVAEITGAQGVAIGSPTYNRKPIPAIVTLAEMLKMSIWGDWSAQPLELMVTVEKLQRRSSGCSSPATWSRWRFCGSSENHQVPRWMNAGSMVQRSPEKCLRNDVNHIQPKKGD
jgi:hypothetical protein